ncbi:MAG: hypothetical protein KGY41_10545 [Desulfovermiculus sp.]|nr:hypothetical protein [Desulfovermiculus sp.]
MSYIDEHSHAARKEELEQGESITHPLNIEEVSFSNQAQMTLRQAVQKIAEYCHVHPDVLSKKLDQKLYWLEPSGTLVITIEVPEVSADMFIELPPGHWWIDNRTCKA